MQLTRRAGLLLHITSLPSRFGIGDFGPEARRFVRFMNQSGAEVWQVLPLVPAAAGNSPYSGLSAFAGNPLLISLEDLVSDRLLTENDLNSYPNLNSDRVDYGSVIANKSRLLRTAFQQFERGRGEIQTEMNQFCLEHQDWLDDYALFVALADSFGTADWSRWPKELLQREATALERWRLRLSQSIAQEKFIQFIFHRQWWALKKLANENQVSLLGDLPIFVAYESADVWANPHCFYLNEGGKRTVVAGVPPDYFSETGQLWGNPLYRWDALARDDYGWWVQRLRHSLQLYDSIRLDHFRGFEAYWEIPADAPTAEKGQWVKGPGTSMFRAAENQLGKLPIVAEDLGMISDEVHQLREDLQFPGMRVYQFGFDDEGGRYHRPESYVENCVAYTGTHDNDTIVGWLQSRSKRLKPGEDILDEYLDPRAPDAYWHIVCQVAESAASTVIIPVQDILGLDNGARMNVPGLPDGNWGWRVETGQLTNEVASRFRELIQRCGRESRSERHVVVT
jgi:4-alpha-glucanotransferase